MTDEPLELGLNHIDALESFSVDSQTSRSRRNNQHMVKFEENGSDRQQLRTHQVKAAISRPGYQHLKIMKAEPEPDPLDPRSTVHSPGYDDENYVSAGK